MRSEKNEARAGGSASQVNHVDGQSSTKGFALSSSEMAGPPLCGGFPHIPLRLDEFLEMSSEVLALIGKGVDRRNAARQVFIEHDWAASLLRDQAGRN